MANLSVSKHNFTAMGTLSYNFIYLGLVYCLPSCSGCYLFESTDQDSGNTTPSIHDYRSYSSGLYHTET